MENDNFDQTVRFNMELALEYAARCLPKSFDTYENRKIIAHDIKECALAGESIFDKLKQAADLSAKPNAGR